MSAPFAWIITRDELEDDDDQGNTAVGVTGPSDAADAAVTAVRSGKGRQFRMYDDDGELYYVGRLFDLTDCYDEAACVAPLDDFGTPNAGCTSVRYPGHLEMDCG